MLVRRRRPNSFGELPMKTPFCWISAATAAAAGPALMCTLLLSGTFMPGVTLGDEPAPPAATTPGSWQQHQYSFQYLGFTSTYSCDGLADKLKMLLLAAGARSDVKSQPGACASGFGRPDKFARADLTFYTLAPLGQGKSGNAAEKPVDGIWRTVAFSDRSPWELRTGDCELVEQFHNQVLPMFTTRNVVSRTTCVPFQESGSVIDLKFESFVAAPQPPTAPTTPHAQIFMYPKNGQNEAQQAADRRECEQWAAQQTGTANAAGYQRAMQACAEAKGYSVQ
jgi:hypothetical protein